MHFKNLPDPKFTVYVAALGRTAIRIVVPEGQLDALAETSTFNHLLASTYVSKTQLEEAAKTLQAAADLLAKHEGLKIR